MNLWRKMLSGVWPEQTKEMEEDTFSVEIKRALEEEKDFWKNPSEFVEPCEVAAFRERWGSAYHTAKKWAEKRLLISPSDRRMRKEAQEFVDVYDGLPGKMHKQNDQLAEKKAAGIAKQILPVEGRDLDAQQMRCIAKDVRNHLVLAGAGTGKTTTIIGYIKYLLKEKRSIPEEILVLSFTNASATEMSERLQKEIGMPVEAKTFHKLGLDIITAVEGKKPKVFAADIRQFIRKQLDILIEDKSYLRKLNSYLIFQGAAQKSEFDFSSQEEYGTYLSYNPPVTINGERVKSYGELEIANFLMQNGIAYEYEKEYPVDTRTSEYGQYHPDFYLPEEDLYIEYFGINRNGEVPSWFSGKGEKTAKELYQDGMKWKRQLHKEQGSQLIEVYGYEMLEGILLTCLEKRLLDAGVMLHPLEPEIVWEKIAGGKNQRIDRIAEFFGTVITLTKSNNCTLEDVRKRNEEYKKSRHIDQVLDLVEPVYNKYQKALEEQGGIDFNDMINRAAAYVEDRKYVSPYQYVIVDEYQDISQARYRLLEVMRQTRDYKLFCVGDDWQSIYRFSGSDIGFILNFEKYWGASEISKIETTYRFSQSLIQVSSDFVMKNPEQKRKYLRSAIPDQGFSVEKIAGYTEEYCVKFLLERLKDLPKGSSVLLLGRYRFDIRMMEQCREVTYRYNEAVGRTEVRYSRRPDLQISFMTVHGSKGLQAEYVFLLNNKARGMGFPSQITDDPVLELLLDNCDHYPFAEERRLFYVAITRAKKKVWLVTIQGNESAFAQEIEKEYGDDMKRAQFTCPLCGGRLVRRSGKYGDFLGCSNYKSNGCRYIRNLSGKR